MRTILTDAAPRPAGHYSQAIVQGGFVFVAGQLPIDPAAGPLRAGDSQPAIEVQVRQALRNVAAILEAAGSGLAHVVRTTVYIADVELWSAVNAAYAECFGEYLPARTIVPSGRLHYGYLVEIDAIAALPSGATGG